MPQTQLDCTPSLLLRSIIAGFPISHFAQQQGVGFPGIHHPDVGRCQCTKDFQTQIIGDKTRKLQTLQENPNFNRISQDKTKIPWIHKTCCSLPPKNLPKFLALRCSPWHQRRCGSAAAPWPQAFWRAASPNRSPW